MVDVRIVRVVIASPSDVAKERAATEPVVEELNGGICKERGCRLGALALGDRCPSRLSPRRARKASSTRTWTCRTSISWSASSGSASEPRPTRPTQAPSTSCDAPGRCSRIMGRPEVMLYFCTRSLKRSDDLVQAQRVRNFHEALPIEQFAWEYGSVASFKDALREHLTRFVQGRVARARTRPACLRPFNLPTVAAAFTGREDELRRLDEALSVDRQSGHHAGDHGPRRGRQEPACGTLRTSNTSTTTPSSRGSVPRTAASPISRRSRPGSGLPVGELAPSRACRARARMAHRVGAAVAARPRQHRVARAGETAEPAHRAPGMC